MATQALYRKWRSQTFDEVIGQNHVTQTLLNALKRDRVAHAYLFSGTRGTGKTSTARLLAKAVNCLAENVADRPCNKCTICTAVNEGRLLDLIEIDAASNTGVDDIRELRDKVGFRPSEARLKIYIIDEVHMLSKSAFNALLKTLEEPPEHVIFVLATTEPERIPATITSRCQRFDFKRIKLEDIVSRLAFIVEEEGLQSESAALEYIARQGNGSMRDSISLLDQLTAYASEIITLDLVRRVLGAVASQAVINLVEALLKRDVAGGLNIINQLVADGGDPRQFTHDIVEYLRSLMLVKLGGGGQHLNLPDETLQAMQSQADMVDSRIIVQATRLFNEALVEIKTGLLDIPQLPLELAFVNAAASPAPVATPAPAEATPTGPPAPAVARQPARPAAAPTPAPTPAPAPTKAQSAPAAASTASGAGVVTLEAVQGCFNQVITMIEPRSKPMAESLRHFTRLHKIIGNEIQIFVINDPAGSLQKRFQDSQPQAAINEAFSQALGQSVIVKFLAEPGEVSAAAQQAEHKNLNELLKTAQDLGGQVTE